ncbi:MAG: hypothetical protein CL944_01580 [Candidatus Diapherotrites archaeon]|uniref:Uncharacterized protein n=1 Tax=Candidatus Iainarchaeum sp. TaxID=3101447 RepID=A0A2D6LPM2_9ARCH|nr:hypothetical protein [Candidatus Diapherotrites archaeon]|tara:strand:- start:3992 stop:4648 length:657 start_codon:yes stop_codon:yes gene_type:complete
MLKEIFKSKRITDLLLISFMVFFVLVAFVLFSPSENSNYRPYRPELYIDDSGNPECPEEFGCCTGEFYKQKKCYAYQACINFKCQIRECTAECCVLDRFERKECPAGLVCDRYECKKPECPYSCCENESEYRDKSCKNNLECTNSNECHVRECKNQCCEGIEGYREVLCPAPQECNNGICEKPECTARCCMANDPDYKEKSCPPHENCVGRVCVIKFF